MTSPRTPADYLHEYEDDTWTRQYLAAVGERVAGILEQRVAVVRN